MKKFLLFSIFLLIILSALAYFLFINSKDDSDSTADAISAIPIDASFIIKVNNFHRFSDNLRNQNRIWETIKPFTSVAKTDSAIAFLDTLSIRSSAFNLLITINPVYISTHVDKNGELIFLSAVKISKGFDKSELSSLTSGFVNNGYKIEKYDFLNVTISTFVDSYKSSDFLSFCIYRGMLICSSSKTLIEKAINQIQSNSSLLSFSSFSTIYQTAGTKVDANLFYNCRNLPLTFKNYIKTPYKEVLNTLSDIADWGELDISLKEEEVFLNGFNHAVDTSNAYLKIFANQHPVENKIASILPSETTFFACLGITNLDGYLTDYRQYLDKTDKILDYTSALSDYNSTLGNNIHELYKAVFLEEIALVHVAFDGADYKDCWYVVMKNRGLGQTKQLFLETLQNYAKSKGLKKSDYKTSFKVDDEKSIDIFKLPSRGINSSLFGSLFSEVSDEYFAFYDDFVIFGSSKESLSKFLLANIRNNLLQLDVSYRQFSNLLAAESNFFIYLKPYKAEALFNNFLDQQSSSSFFDHFSALKRIQGVSLQMNGGSSMLFNNISFQYSPYISEEPQTDWETRLDTVFTMKPQIVINHITKNQEIFVQDVKNKVYLLNDVGRVIWTKQLPEPIIGEVEQVDLLKNNKLQFIFNTRSFVFAIDRRGSFVEGYPVKLKSKATNPVAIFDYDGSREYRLFVACEDQKIYSYNNNGKPVTGWNFRKSERRIYNQLQHFRIKGKDYIVFADENRPYILDRKGEERVTFSHLFSKSINSNFTLDKANSNHTDRLVTTDSVGLIKYIYFNGKIDDFAIKAFSASHAFDFIDIDSDGKEEFVFLDKSQLYVYKQNKNLMFLYKFDAEIDAKILNISLSKSSQYLGFSSSTSRKLYLINGDGSLYSGFPLKGCSPFSIAKLTNSGVTFNLFTGSPRGMLLNYAVK